MVGLFITEQHIDILSGHLYNHTRMMPICDVICKGSSEVKLIFSDIIKWMCYLCLKYQQMY